MAVSCVGSFHTWLSEKLLCINKDVDLDVFVEYITGILDTDTSRDDKTESLEEIIGEILPCGSTSEHCTEIVDKWLQMSDRDGSSSTDPTAVGFDSTIHNLIAKQTEQTVVRKPKDSEDIERKKAILAQYAELSDGEEFDADADDVKSKSAMPANTAKSSCTDSASTATSDSSADLLVKNMNAVVVKERERTERERAKNEAETKRQKDKDDREKQKQKAQERKDAEKKRTQKGEKRR